MDDEMTEIQQARMARWLKEYGLTHEDYVKLLEYIATGSGELPHTEKGQAPQIPTESLT